MLCRGAHGGKCRFDVQVTRQHPAISPSCNTNIRNCIMDFFGIFDGFSTTIVVVVIVVAGAFVAAVGFGKWAMKKVVSFFG